MYADSAKSTSAHLQACHKQVENVARAEYVRRIKSPLWGFPFRMGGAAYPTQLDPLHPPWGYFG